MQEKEYRVVCSRPKFGETVIVDIAPARGVIHDQIFFSRRWIHKQQTGEDLVKYNYSFMIKEIDGKEPEIMYPEMLNTSKNSEAYRIIMRDYEELTPDILKTFKQMRARGQSSTLHVYSIAEQTALEETNKTPQEEAFDRKQRAKRARIMELTAKKDKYQAAELKNKKNQHVYPQNLQQENNMHMAEEFKQTQRRRIAGEIKRSRSTIPAWLRHQNEYSGD